ncbi:MAG: TRAP transporter large permease [Rhodobacteraceae bacterium]|nr:TRAP transporter large permease [Paracoccaceae bacterium]
MEIVSLYLLLPFFVLLAINASVAVALGLSSAIFLLFSGTRLPPLLIVTEMYDSIAKFALLALPMFVLTGELLNRFELTERLIALARIMVGWMRGGLAHVNVTASMLFAGISGSIFGDLASVGSIMIPSMIRERYPAGFSAAVTAASALIGAIIPPSTVMIIIGAHLGISIGGLFAAGIVPGLLIGVALMAVAFVASLRHGYGEIYLPSGAGEILEAVLRAAPVVTIPLFLIGGIVLGVFTPTEAGAAAVLYSLFLGLLYRKLSPRVLGTALAETVRISASALFIVSTAFVFSRILTFQRVPQELLNLLLTISENPVIAILILTGLLLVVGAFMDALANMIILGPLLMPVMVDGLGLHPLQFGIWLMVGLLLGLLTPPLGLCLFMVAPLANTSLMTVARAVLPFLAAEIVVLLGIAFWPGLTLFVPRVAGLIQ